MRRIALAGAALVLAACGGGGRPMEPYYDPAGRFSLDLPTRHEVQPLQPAPADDASGFPEVLGGVFSSEQPTQQSATGFGVQTNQPDLTQYFVVVLGTLSRDELEAFMVRFRIQRGGDLEVDAPATVGDRAGRLIVTNFDSGESGAYVMATALVQTEDVGYVIGASFPGDDWRQEREDFTRILDSFRSGAPPGVTTLPLAGV